MDIVLFITSRKNANRVNMVRGDKRFVQKTLKQILGVPQIDLVNLFSEGHLDINGQAFSVHESFHSIKEDIESLKSIQAVLIDVKRFQTGEHVKILRDAVVQIERTIQNICNNFSE